MRLFNFDNFLYLAFLLFLFFFPLSQGINFMQNDDWVYYNMTESFLEGSTSLHRLSPSIFYTQGLLAAAYSVLFPVGTLPILTLLVSIVSFYLFSRILFDHYYVDVVSIALLSLLLFFNPINIYSSLGFMTEAYMLLMLLLTIYYIHSFEVYDRPSDYVLVTISTIVAFFIRQVSVVISLSFGIYLLLKRKYFYGLFQLFLSFGMIAFYYLLFPRTIEMTVRKSLVFENLVDLQRSAMVLYALLIVISAFLLPLAVREFLVVFEKKTYRVLGAYVFGMLLSCGIYRYFFDPTIFRLGEFPYFGNSFSKSGFLSTGIQGQMPGLPYMNEVFEVWELLGVLGVGIMLVHVFRLIKNRALEFNSVYIVVYLFTLLLFPEIFDRYLLFLFPIVILLLVQTHKNFSYKFKFVSLVFLLGLAFLNYQFSSNFVRTNQFIWSESVKLVTEEGVSPGKIKANSAWQSAFEIDEVKYLFSYDSPGMQRQVGAKYKLINAKKINFPLNYYRSSTIFVYELVPEIVVNINSSLKN